MGLADILYSGIPNLSSVVPPEKLLTAMPNIFGGMDLLSPTGQILAFTIPNVFGGEDLFGADWTRLGHTQPNVFGGEDLFGADWTRLGHTQPNIFGGEDLFGGIDMPDDFFSAPTLDAVSESFGGIDFDLSGMDNAAFMFGANDMVIADFAPLEFDVFDFDLYSLDFFDLF